MGQAGKDEEKEGRFSSGLPLMQCVLDKTSSGATENESATEVLLINLGRGQYAPLR